MVVIYYYDYVSSKYMYVTVQECLDFAVFPIPRNKGFKLVTTRSCYLVADLCAPETH